MNTDNTFDPTRIAVAGRCGCGSKIVRGFDDTGEHVSVNARIVDAATELTAWAAGTRSYRVELRRQHPYGLVIWSRTRVDIKRRPAGFREHIYIEHHCDPKGTT